MTTTTQESESATKEANSSEQKPPTEDQDQSPKTEQKSKSVTQKQSPAKSKYPKVKRARYINFNPEGNTQYPLIGLALCETTASGRLDILIFPESGGEVIKKNGVPHESEFDRIENPNVRRHGSWSVVK